MFKTVHEVTKIFQDKKMENRTNKKNLTNIP